MIFLPKFWIGVDQDGWDALARATKLERGTFYCLLLMMLVLLLLLMMLVLLLLFPGHTLAWDTPGHRSTVISKSSRDQCCYH